MTKRMLRYQVPVDGKVHEINFQGDVQHVEAARDETNSLRHAVDFWAEADLDASSSRRFFHVFGTGWEVPSTSIWRGTTARTQEGLVWHLYELPGDTNA